MKVSDVMSKDVADVSPAASCLKAAAKMREASVGLLVVSNDGEVAGIIADRDLVPGCVALGADPCEHTIDEYMNGHPTRVHEWAPYDCRRRSGIEEGRADHERYATTTACPWLRTESGLSESWLSMT